MHRYSLRNRFDNRFDAPRFDPSMLASIWSPRYSLRSLAHLALSSITLELLVASILASRRFDTDFDTRLDTRCFDASPPRLSIHGFVARFDATRFDRSKGVLLLLPFLRCLGTWMLCRCCFDAFIPRFDASIPRLDPASMLASTFGHFDNRFDCFCLT